MSGFGQPPHREMPPEVRERLRRRLWHELDAPRRTTFSARMPVTAALGVVVLVVAAVIFAQTVPAATQTAVPRPAAPASSAPRQSAEDLDRCYRAVSTSGRRVVAPPQWTIAYTREIAGVSVTAAYAGGRPLFCETTLTSVTVSDPDAQPGYAAGAGTGTLLATPNGTVAGVVDPGWDRFEIRVVNGSTLGMAQPDTAKGLFVTYTSTSIDARTLLYAQQLPPTGAERPDDDDAVYPLRDMAPAPPPAASSVDRVVPSPDRESPRGQAFGQCTRDTRDPVPDRDSWQPGAVGTVGGYELLMGSNAKGVAACQWRPGSGDHRFRAYLGLARRPDFVDAAQIPLADDGRLGLVIAGTVRPDATRMSVVADGNVELDTDVRNGTFVSVVPDSLRGNASTLDRDRLDQITTVIYDAKGNVLYDGRLNPR